MADNFISLESGFMILICIIKEKPHKVHSLIPRRPSNTQQELLNEFNNSHLEENINNDSPQSGDATPTFDEPDDEGGTGNETG